MPAHTPLFEQHQSQGGRMVDFGGWALPVHYGSQVEEHHAVRQEAGLFDVSHMTVVDFEGEGCRDFLSELLANNVAKLKRPGRALYTCMLAENGGIIDDLIVYGRPDGAYRAVVNAATREKDLAWIRAQAEGTSVSVIEREDLAMLAVQGPRARDAVHGLLDDADRGAVSALGRFWAWDSESLFIARTGYTGEDGYEMLMDASAATRWWEQLLEAGVAPCGLGARDTLRLEAGLSLYGQDIDETTTPAESRLQWTVDLSDNRRFVGRSALEAQLEAGVPRKLVGLVLEGRGVLRQGQTVVSEETAGVVTSGTFSPTLKQSIGLARVPVTTGDQVAVDIRGREVPARVVEPPFVSAADS
ncbi:MAG: glycine cleavage system aminomethyltransferase GcvT [Pseudomonadota bacterium]